MEMYYDAQSYSCVDLHKLCREGDMIEIYKLPFFLPEVNERDGKGFTPLCIALRHQVRVKNLLHVIIPYHFILVNDISTQIQETAM